MCVESLEDETKQHFHKLVVFDHDTIISAEVLVTVMDVEDELAAEDIMTSESTSGLCDVWSTVLEGRCA